MNIGNPGLPAGCSKLQKKLPMSREVVSTHYGKCTLVAFVLQRALLLQVD